MVSMNIKKEKIHHRSKHVFCDKLNESGIISRLFFRIRRNFDIMNKTYSNSEGT